MPIQQMLLGAGAVAKKTYIDDVFATTLYVGNESSKTVTTGIDLATDGGLLWGKSRLGSHAPFLYDTERGVQKYYRSDNNDSETTLSTGLTAFSTTGFSLGSHVGLNDDVKNLAWSFKRTAGFFDVVTWTGNGSTGTGNSARAISHNLGSVPGMIITKASEDGVNWGVYHRGVHLTSPEQYHLSLNESNSRADASIFGDRAPTSTHFYISDNGGEQTNSNNKQYVGYVFAGGESTAATACSVNFNAGSDYLATQSTTYNFGTGDFTIEFWARLDTDIGTNATAAPGFFQLGTSASLQDDFKWMSVRARNDNNGRWQMLIKSTSTTNPTTYSSANGDFPQAGQWYHVALVRHSSKTSLYINGTQKIGPIDDTTNYNFDDLLIGSYYSDGYGLDGQISNFRIVKGSAVYTSSFKPPTAPLTSITNTILLCCQSSSITAATTIPGTQTISSNGSPSANASHPFDDPAGFVFGDAGDQNIIKCGSYIGNGSTGTNANNVYLGFEPQWLLIKSSSESGTDWMSLNSMSGIPGSSGHSPYLKLNTYDQEKEDDVRMQVTSTGFSPTDSEDTFNKDGETYVYVAIRRPDGYVAKPPELGTDVFNIAYGDNDGEEPSFKPTNFAVDIGLIKAFASSQDWPICTRLTQGKQLFTNTNGTEGNNSNAKFDYQSGWNAYTSNNTSNISWMWKRHAGLDVVTCLKEFNSHNLGKIPEMVWIKRRDNTSDWFVWHKELNGGTNDGLGYNLRLNTYASENSTPSLCPIGDQLPTATHFKTASDSDIRNVGSIAVLFASVDGISSVGGYTGSSSNVTVNCGFQPRFILIKENSATRQWVTFDTVRGIQSPGVDQQLYLSANYAQDDDQDYLDISSTGFTVKTNSTNVNQDTQNYIYYAHA